MHGTRYIGVDCGEKYHSAVLLSSEGQHVSTVRVENRRDSIERSILALCRKVEADEQIAIVLESLYGFSSLVVEVARDQSFAIWQANSKALNHFRDLEGQPHKDDDRDGYLLARMAYMRLEGCRLAVSATPEEQVLRRLSRLHAQVTEQRKQAKLRLRSRLVEMCPVVVSKAWKGPKWSSVSFLATLERWPGFDGLEKARLSSIQRVLAKAYSGSAATLESQARALKVLASELPKTLEHEVITLELSCLVTQIRAASVSLKPIDDRIQAQVSSDPVAKKLLEVPGVGPFTAAVLTGELRPLARACSEAKVATYAGLTPLNRRSGLSGRRVLAKGVNKHAQQGCYMSALASLKHSALDNAYYRKQHRIHRGHPKPHVVALLALARQRLKMLYKLLTSDAVYDKEILITSHLQRQLAQQS